MRKGGIDCMVCMFGAPYPDCCMYDCGKSDRCVGCMWYAKHVFKTKAKIILAYDLKELLNDDISENSYGGDISKYGIKYQAPEIDCSLDLDAFDEYIEQFMKTRKQIVFIPRLRKVKNGKKIVKMLHEKNINSTIVEDLQQT